MEIIKTPCVGICTATALGDAICRGCGRKAEDVINWNGYTNEKKREIIRKLEEDKNSA